MQANNYNAAELLSKMRPHIEVVLKRVAEVWADEMPSCTSQMYRCMIAQKLLRQKLEQLNAEPVDEKIKRRWAIMRALEAIGDFMHVWHAVNICDYPDNNCWVMEGVDQNAIQNLQR